MARFARMYASMSGRALKKVCAALWSRGFALDGSLCVFRRGVRPEGEMYFIPQQIVRFLPSCLELGRSCPSSFVPPYGELL